MAREMSRALREKPLTSDSGIVLPLMDGITSLISIVVAAMVSESPEESVAERPAIIRRRPIPPPRTSVHR